MTQKAEDYLSKKSEVVKMITTVGQQSDGFGGAQATAYKSEIDVILVGKDKEQITHLYTLLRLKMSFLRY